MEQEIPRSQWNQFLKDFSRRHQGWLADLEVSGRDVGDQVAAKALPFRGVSYEDKGSGSDSLLIFLGQELDRDETHTITAPKHIAFQQDQQGRDQALAVESSDGSVTVMHFVNPSFPEMENRI